MARARSVRSPGGGRRCRSGRRRCRCSPAQSTRLLIPAPPCRLDAVDFEVLLYTNTFPDGEAAAGGRQAYQDSVEPLFTRRRPAGAEPLKAIINVDGEGGPGPRAEFLAGGPASPRGRQ